MRLVVGLGNPGPKHARNRHNIGFVIADEIARRYGFPPYRKRFQSEAADGTIAGEKVLLLKPQTYMNLSGQAVGEAMRFFKLAPGDVTVIHDEIELAPGKVRVKRGGGHSGNNGVRDCIRHLGPDFWRVRVGVGHPGDKNLVHAHVLNDFSKAEEPMIDKLVDAIADEFPSLIEGDDGRFMSKVALVINPPRPKPPRPPKVTKVEDNADPAEPESETGTE